MKRATKLIVETLSSTRPDRSDREAFDQWSETRKAFADRLEESATGFDRNSFYVETNG